MNTEIKNAFNDKYPDFESNIDFVLDTIELLRESGYIEPNTFRLYERTLKWYKENHIGFELTSISGHTRNITQHILGYAIKPDQVPELMYCLVTHTRLRKRKAWYQHEYFWYAAAIIVGIALAILDIKVNGL